MEKVICHINPKYAYLKEKIQSLPDRFETEGETIYAARNTLKVIECDGIRFCVKSYRPPHILNRFVYAHFRKPKAERAFIYASHFLSVGVNTPEPVAYITCRHGIGITRSYYICLQLDRAYTFRRAITAFPAEQESILRGIARFTFDFHRKQIYFIDHSGGNTLLKRNENGTFDFYLVDLNRTQLTRVSYKKGLQNLSKLELEEPMLRIVADEYAKLWHADSAQAQERLINLTCRHNRRTRRKSFIRNTRKKIKRMFIA